MPDEAPQLAPQKSPEQIAEENAVLRELLAMQKDALASSARPAAGIGKDPNKHAYYNERYGAQMLRYIEQMHRDKLAVIFRYAAYAAANIKHNTLYMKIQMGLSYARDHMIKDPVLAAFAKDIAVRKRPQGICLFYEKEMGDELSMGMPMSPDEIAENYESIVPSASQQWNTQVQNFIDHAITGERLHLKDLRLTDEDVAKCRIMCRSIANLVSTINHYEVKLIKLSPDDYNALMQHP